jgi:hypothetical protein
MEIKFMLLPAREVKVGDWVQKKNGWQDWFQVAAVEPAPKNPEVDEQWIGLTATSPAKSRADAAENLFLGPGLGVPPKPYTFWVIEDIVIQVGRPTD